MLDGIGQHLPSLGISGLLFVMLAAQPWRGGAVHPECKRR